MGLDQYAYRAAQEGQWMEFWNNARLDVNDNWYSTKGTAQPEEMAHWRKHPNLRGWISRLYYSRGGGAVFNG